MIKMTPSDCLRCSWFNPRSDFPRMGECRASEPGLGQGQAPIWPIVHDDDWCGDFTEDDASRAIRELTEEAK